MKYIGRAGRKDPSAEIEDLRNAAWYIEHRIKLLEKKKNEQTENEHEAN